VNAATRRLIGPGLASLATFVLLAGLGVWQLQRLAWKRRILAEIAHAETAPPVPLGAGMPPPFTRVEATGTLRGAPYALYGAEVRPVDGVPRMGAQLLELLQRQGLPPVVVDLGWVPGERDTTVRVPSGAARIIGYVRPRETPGLLSAGDDLADRHFYTLDPVAIGAALGAANVAPFTLVAMGPPAGPGAPDPAHSLPRPPNNHLLYALTWFGLGLADIAVFIAFARGALAEAEGAPDRT
jgi:surfeit locus 1 family protein